MQMSFASVTCESGVTAHFMSYYPRRRNIRTE